MGNCLRPGNFGAVAWRFAAVVWLGGLCFTGSGKVLSQEPAPSATNEAQRQTLQRRWDAARQEAVDRRQKGELDEAIVAAEQAIELLRQLDAAPDRLLADLSWLADCLEQAESFDKAAARRQEILKLALEFHGEGHWRVADARRANSDLQRLKTLPPDLRLQTAKTVQLTAELADAVRKGELHKSVELANKLVEKSTDLWGEKHPKAAESLFNLAHVHVRTGDLKAALPILQQVLEVRTTTLSDTHPLTAQTLNALGWLEGELHDFPAAQAHLQKAVAVYSQTLGPEHSETALALNNLAITQRRRGNPVSAVAVFQQALTVRTKTLGASHVLTGEVHYNLAQAYSDLGDSRQALSHLSVAVGILKEKQGAQHPRTVQAIHELGRAYLANGEHAQAEQYLVQAWEIRRQLWGDGHRDTIASVHALGLLAMSLRDLDRAERLLREALQARRTLLGERHLDTAKSLDDLGTLYIYTGDYYRAESLLKEALDTRIALLGESHPYVALSRSSLGRLAFRLGDLVTAQRSLERAQSDLRAAYGDEAGATFDCTCTLGGVYLRQGDYQSADALLKQALKIARAHKEKVHGIVDCLQMLGDLCQRTNELPRAQVHLEEAIALGGGCDCCRANCLSALAQVYSRQDQTPQAEQCMKDALECAVQGHGQHHPHTAEIYQADALYHANMGNSLRAAIAVRRAIAIRRESLDLNFVVQSERQQIIRSAELRDSLDLLALLAVEPNNPISATELYQHVMAWKGAVFARQKAARNDAAESQLAMEHREVCGRLAAMFYSHPPQGETERVAWLKATERLHESKERLEIELARADTESGRTQPATRQQPEELARALPADTVLLDFFEYAPSISTRKAESGTDAEKNLLCFVVRRDKKVQCVNLGAQKPIAEMVGAWRRSVQQRSKQEYDLALKLRGLLWNKLEPHLASATTILISPDGVTARFPFAAMAGKERGKRLVEEAAVVVIPVPQMLAGMVSTKAAVDVAEHGSPRLLLVGNVDFNADPGPTAPVENRAQQLVAATPLAKLASGTAASGPRDGERAFRFNELPGTQQELNAVEKLFETEFKSPAVVIQGAAATESAFRESAPRFRNLHMATHGFFAAAGVQPAFLGNSHRGLKPFWSPGSDARFDDSLQGFHPGLLSGIALTGANHRQASTANSMSKDDGILTAVEVSALNLSDLNLVVLSACETGLGTTAGGEGILGLQRAFQTAGAKTTVASLWKVDDRATHQFMTKFYENLWAKKLPRGEALRQAQLWMMQGGMKFGMSDTAHDTEQPPDASPYYWAGFVLSGEWR